MRKVFAILLIAAHLFNVCGYRMFFSLIESRADEKIIASLDKDNYNQNDLLQIKLSLNMPYLQGNGRYERCDGEIEYHGVRYNYVKRMVQNDTLYLYCIPNQEKTALSKAKNGYVKQNADDPSGKTSEQATVKKISPFSEYSTEEFRVRFDTNQSRFDRVVLFNNLTTLKGFSSKHLRPPELFI